MYTDNRDAYRQVFFDVWQKHLKKLPLTAQESEILDIMLAHPEYHRLLDDPKTFLTQNFATEENPFVHMSLHIALREQLRMDRPSGIREIYQQYQQKFSAHDAQHKMTGILANMLYEAQRTGMPADENVYLLRLKEGLF